MGGRGTAAAETKDVLYYPINNNRHAVERSVKGSSVVVKGI